jgi:hypothetical protein
MLGAVKPITLPVMEEYNHNEINISTLAQESLREGRKAELLDIIYQLRAVKHPTKQVQQLLQDMVIRWQSYNQEASE